MLPEELWGQEWGSIDSCMNIYLKISIYLYKIWVRINYEICYEIFVENELLQTKTPEEVMFD